ncbi:hypothetical protein JL721_8564 [Aureococcus anophagefferens]|nr:hypothetical protein JL721_8564 [Aureococcus anophagefferens]
MRSGTKLTRTSTTRLAPLRSSPLSTTTTTTPSDAAAPAFDASAFLAGAQTLAAEAARIAQETGPRAAAARTFRASARSSTRSSSCRASSVAAAAATLVEAATAAQRAGGDGAAAAFAEPLLAWARENVPPELAPRFARKFSERLGATYVKLGQFVASSPTLFPELWVREFEKTLDDVPPVAFSVIKGVVERELEPAGGYLKFDRAPLAAASIAQVHRATLRDEFGGGDVVVKVLRPGVDDLLKADLGFLEIAGKAAEALAPSFGRLSLANVLEDLRATMLDELDLEKEAANLEVFRAWLATAGLEATATCPLPVKAAIEARVLTMDYTTLLNALNTWSLGVLSCDFFHADVHAGNLLALRDGRVAFLDFGIVGRVPERIWTSLQDAAAGLASRDFELLARALTTMGAAERVDERAFAADLEALFKSLDEVQPDVLVSADGAGAVAATVSVDDAQVTDLLLQVVNVTERDGIKLPREFGLLVKQALYFDRYTRLLAPDMDVINDDRVAFSAQLS